MSTKAQAKTQAKTPAAPAAARIPQPTAAVPEHEAERPDIAAQLEGAARLGHSLGAVGVDLAAPTIIQRQEIPEEEEEELQLKREPAAVQRQDLPEEEEEELMMKRDDRRVGPRGGPVPPEVETAIGRARGGGQPLEPALRAHMSEALGHDFSGVRVHTDAEAEELNKQLSAKAFTTGADIFFQRGAYAPESSSGREFIAHELTHVLQQGTGRVPGGGGLHVRPGGDAFEQETDVMGREATQIKSISSQQRAVARPDLASPADILALQRTVGNRAAHRLQASQKVVGKGVGASAIGGRVRRVAVVQRNKNDDETKEGESKRTGPVAAVGGPLAPNVNVEVKNAPLWQDLNDIAGELGFSSFSEVELRRTDPWTWLGSWLWGLESDPELFARRSNWTGKALYKAAIGRGEERFRGVCGDTANLIESMMEGGCRTVFGYENALAEIDKEENSYLRLSNVAGHDFFVEKRDGTCRLYQSYLGEMSLADSLKMDRAMPKARFIKRFRDVFDPRWHAAAQQALFNAVKLDWDLDKGNVRCKSFGGRKVKEEIMAYLSEQLTPHWIKWNEVMRSQETCAVIARRWEVIQ